jgi:hypothetical protein
MIAYCDSDCAGDKNRRKCVFQFCNVHSRLFDQLKVKKQKSVTLSSSEAEYVAISEICAEIVFLKQIIEFMEVIMKLPILLE